MKVTVILGLLLAVAFAEEKINLEDIERDNLRAESKSSSDDIQNDETASYGVTGKPETIKQNYQQTRPEEYQDVKYLTNDLYYRQTSAPIQYPDYQQQLESAVPKGLSQATTYESPQQQQLYYQPEVTVGNHYQSVQQKTATEKYDKNSNKETLYVKIPMSHLLSYYPNLGLAQSSISKSQSQPLLHRLAGQPLQQIAIPIYMPPIGREQIYSPSKVMYHVQPQYVSQASRYPQQTVAILPTKQPNKLIYAQALLSHPPQSHQQQYLQEIVYTQQQPGTYAPTLSSNHATSSYENPTNVHLESNALGQSYASQSRQQYAPYERQPLIHYAVSPETYAPQIGNQIYQQQSSENVPQDYETLPDAPGSHLDLPRLPAQNFKTVGTTRLLPISSVHDDARYAKNHLIHSSEPRSLLESYVPSHLLAAQDSERYRERSLKLESGFLPSKINYVQSYKKRKVEGI